MALTTTANYGLLKRRGDVESSRNYQSTDADLDVIDGLLRIGSNHVHSGESAMVDPTTGPTLVVSDTGGNLTGGVTFEYVISWVDDTGESAMSSLETIATAAQLDDPAAPTLADSGVGTLSNGSYFYKVTAVDTDGNETTASAQAALELRTSNRKITCTFPTAPSGTVSWNIYRRINSGSFYYVDNEPVASPTYVDDGTVTPNYARIAPTSNNTNSTNKVNIDISALSIPSQATFWKIYRRVSGEDWGSTNLVATTAIGTTNYDDTTSSMNPGSPREATSCYGQPSKIDLSSETTGTVPGTCISFFLPGTLVNGATYVQTTIPYDITPTSIDAYWVTAPTGTDGSHYVSIWIDDDVATPKLISIDNTSGANLVNYAQEATPKVISAGLITVSVSVTDSATPQITNNGADVNLVIWY